MPLETYQKKRKFSGKGKTNEPKGKTKKTKTKARKSKEPIFVIHEHHASHLHWDLRLEMNGALASWAVPKNPEGLARGAKRLAVQVEDHPLEYAKFRGVIPEGNYGAGKVLIWDKGTYYVEYKNDKKIEFFLKGKKLKGMYILIKTHYGDKPEKSWLWFKVSDKK